MSVILFDPGATRKPNPAALRLDGCIRQLVVRVPGRLDGPRIERMGQIAADHLCLAGGPGILSGPKDLWAGHSVWPEELVGRTFCLA